jgi:nitrite reductase/ring-hydroxylating ferredoxin subunit
MPANNMPINYNQGTGPVLCRSEELLDPGSRAFDFLWQGEMVEMFVVRKHGQVFGYLNQCPHTGGPLDWTPNEFLDQDERYIQCANHDALFAIKGGRCMAGPCVGDKLTPLPVYERDGLVMLDVAMPAELG